MESVCPIRGAAKLPEDYTRSFRVEMAVGADFRGIHNLEPGLVPDGQSPEEMRLESRRDSQAKYRIAFLYLASSLVMRTMSMRIPRRGFT